MSLEINDQVSYQASKQITRKEVLLVENNSLIARIHKNYFHQCGCNVTLAENGEQTLASLNKHFDLIALDLGLPDIFGVELCEKIRAAKVTTPIVIVTALDDDFKAPALAAGANDFYIKPVPKFEFQGIINKWCPAFVTGN